MHIPLKHRAQEPPASRPAVKLWQRLACAMLCLVLLGSNLTVAFATEGDPAGQSAEAPSLPASSQGEPDPAAQAGEDGSVTFAELPVDQEKTDQEEPNQPAEAEKKYTLHLTHRYTDATGHSVEVTEDVALAAADFAEGPYALSGRVRTYEDRATVAAGPDAVALADFGEAGTASATIEYTVANGLTAQAGEDGSVTFAELPVDQEKTDQEEPNQPAEAEKKYTLHLTHRYTDATGHSVEVTEDVALAAADFAEGAYALSGRVRTYEDRATVAAVPDAVAPASFGEAGTASATIEYTVANGLTAQAGEDGTVSFAELTITGWRWKNGLEVLSEYDGEWYLNQPAADMQALTAEEREALLERLHGQLPTQVRVTLSNGVQLDRDLTWPALDLGTPTAEKIYRFDARLDWTYPLDEGVPDPCVFFTFGEKETHSIREFAWHLVLTGPKDKWSNSDLAAMLPRQMQVPGPEGKPITVKLAWSPSPLAKEGQTRFDASVVPEDGAEDAPVQVLLPCVYFTFTQPKVAYITGWTWVEQEDYEGLLQELDGVWYLSLAGMDEILSASQTMDLDVQEPAPGQTEDEAWAENLQALKDVLTEVLPGQIHATLEGGTEADVQIQWDYSGLEKDPVVIGSPEDLRQLGGTAQEADAQAPEDQQSGSTQWTFYPLTATVEEGYQLKPDAPEPKVWLNVGGVQTLENYPGIRRGLTAADKFDDHLVQGMQPENVTVNLFDYNPEIGKHDGNSWNDLLEPASSFTKNSNGINSDALLLFGGSNMQEAGFWNLGSGAGRPWGKANTNMKGIVRSTLVDGYPYINLDKARSSLENPVSPDIVKDTWPSPLMDVANLNNAEFIGAGIGEARALSKKLLESRDLNVDANGKVSGECPKASLSYLFDPDENADGKDPHKDVKNLFQVDSEGYYYYNARQNFAEYNRITNSFTLYDGPAVWRTDAGYNSDTGEFDGDKSLGNFFPFNSASEVFDSIQTEDKDGNATKILSSSEKITNVGNAVLANHYMGMTVTIDFNQPLNGMINNGNRNIPMTFEFSGDDDVWVFVDDVLVLDIGGVHSELYGSINFATGEVMVGQSWRSNGNAPTDGVFDESTLKELFTAAGKEDTVAWNGKTFSSNSAHTLKMFYLERGNYDSSLRLRFNLQPQLYHEVKKVDQNGRPLQGVRFNLYEAVVTSENDPNALRCTNVAGLDDVYVKQANDTVLATLTTDENGLADIAQTGVDGNRRPFNFADRGIRYYILRETQSPQGYRSLPVDIVLEYNPGTTMLVVANRWTTGSYASFSSTITGNNNVSYGTIQGDGSVVGSGKSVSQEYQQNGLVVAIPALKQSDGTWVAGYGDNLNGFSAYIPSGSGEDALRRAALEAALNQMSLHVNNSLVPAWYLTWDANDGRLEGYLTDLPGRADRYELMNSTNADLRMVYALITPGALNQLGITGDTEEARYKALGQKVASDGVGAIADRILHVQDGETANSMGFSFLDVSTFGRIFRSLIYIPNEQRELRVQKVSQDGVPLNGAQFALYASEADARSGTNPVARGTTARVDDEDGILIFRPQVPNGKEGYAQMVWANATNTEYYLRETASPNGYKVNETVIPVIVGIYSIYADAGKPDDGVTVMAGVGKLTQTMVKFAANGDINVTLQDITAFCQRQESGHFSLTGWVDDTLEGTSVVRSMNLHYGLNALVDYGLHDSDGGKTNKPFFITDTGFIRTRVEQNYGPFDGSHSMAQREDLGDDDLTSLFSLLNTVVVTDEPVQQTNTGTLTIRKTVTGTGLPDADYTRNFAFTVELTDEDGNALKGDYFYISVDKSGYIRSGETLLLHHDEAVIIRGLPQGTRFTVTEAEAQGWHVMPTSGTISGTVEANANATFTNYKGDLQWGSLTVTKTVAGNAGDANKDFAFTVTLADTTVSGSFGDMTFANGVARFTLRHNQSKTASGLPVGAAYTVEEAEANRDGYTTTSTGATGTIRVSGSTAAFTNTRSTPPTGSLTVTKTVTGSSGDREKAFTFVVTLDDETVSGTYGEMIFAGGRTEFTLKHGERKTAEDLPAGVEYTVVERDNGGYTVRKTGDIGVIRENRTAYARFTNRKTDLDNQPRTGDDTKLGLWVGLSVLCLAGAAASLALGRKRRGRYSK